MPRKLVQDDPLALEKFRGLWSVDKMKALVWARDNGFAINPAVLATPELDAYDMALENGNRNQLEYMKARFRKELHEQAEARDFARELEQVQVLEAANEKLHSWERKQEIPPMLAKTKEEKVAYLKSGATKEHPIDVRNKIAELSAEEANLYSQQHQGAIAAEATRRMQVQAKRAEWERKRNELRKELMWPSKDIDRKEYARSVAATHEINAKFRDSKGNIAETPAYQAAIMEARAKIQEWSMTQRAQLRQEVEDELARRMPPPPEAA